MVQGTTSQAAWAIAQGGFGVIASENDQGWYGKGIYFTSSLEYARMFAEKKVQDLNKSTPQEEPKKSATLICAVVPGNVFPVIDLSLEGKPVKDGYQSHYTIGDYSFTPFLFCFDCYFENKFCFCSSQQGEVSRRQTNYHWN
jgi:hypothetical protein